VRFFLNAIGYLIDLRLRSNAAGDKEPLFIDQYSITERPLATVGFALDPLFAR